MSTLSEPDTTEHKGEPAPIDYEAVEGLRTPGTRAGWNPIALGLIGLFAVMALVVLLPLLLDPAA